MGLLELGSTYVLGGCETVNLCDLDPTFSSMFNPPNSASVCVCVCVCVWRARCRLEDWLMKENFSDPMKVGIRNAKESKVIRASRTSCPSKFGQS